MGDLMLIHEIVRWANEMPADAHDASPLGLRQAEWTTQTTQVPADAHDAGHLYEI